MPDHVKRLTIFSGIILSFFLFVNVSLFLTSVLKPAHLSDEAELFISRLTFWLCLLVMCVYAVKVEKQPLLLWPDIRYDFLVLLSSVILVLVILMAGMAVISWIGISFGLHNKSDKLNDMVAVLRKNRGLLVFTCLTAAVTEELVFRGYLIPRLQLFFKSPYPALVIASVLFGVAHIGYGSVAQVLGPLFIGFIFALYYQQYRNIKVLIVCHFLWDLFTLLILTH